MPSRRARRPCCVATRGGISPHGVDYSIGRDETSVLHITLATPPPQGPDAAVIVAAKPFIAWFTSADYARTATVVRVVHSTLHPLWADVIVRSKTDGVNHTLMVRRGGRWYPRNYGAPSFDCREAPPGVVRELMGSCDAGRLPVQAPPFLDLYPLRFSIPCGVVRDRIGVRFQMYLNQGFDDCRIVRQAVAGRPSVRWRHFKWHGERPWTDAWERVNDGIERISAIRG